MMREGRLNLLPISDWDLFADDSTFSKHTESSNISNLASGPYLISGPCSAESSEQMLETAFGLKKIGVDVFRAGIWKPRTHPNQFEGLGEPGLKLLKEVKEKTGMKICTEIACKEHLEMALKYDIDMIWIGARTTSNPFLVQEIADALIEKNILDMPVLVKNPISPDLGLWRGALERLNQAGVRKLGVILRGFTTSEKQIYRNNPGWKMAVELRSMYSSLPFFCDPSHISGKREYLQEISQRALDLGLDGLMIESHCNPEQALSDSQQQLNPSDLQKIINNLVVRNIDCDNPDYKENIDILRANIDILDEELLEIFNRRMSISEKIGHYKKEHNITILQADRWDSILSTMVAKGSDKGLSEEFIRAVFNAVHQESLKIQNKVLSKK